MSGGSAIAVAVECSRLIDQNLANRLTVSLVDERFGNPGHDDSNWKRLIDSGFRLTGAKLRPILNGSDFKQTATSQNQFIKKALSLFDYRLSLLGMGADGHTAGILPHSPVIQSDDYVSCFKGPDYKRITLTPKGISKMDEVVLFAFGADKLNQLELLAQTGEIEKQPAQAIKNVPVASVYSNLIGEKI